jgi:NAD(P)H-dependent flavin oxidoreductase YrpB (nitropropane dioxygenase family)
VGLLDLGLTKPVEALRQAIERLDRYSTEPSMWGVRWDTLGAETRMPNMLSALRKEPFPYLLLAGLRGKGSSAQIRTALEQARTLARVVLLEVYDAEAARAAATSSIDGVVIKAGEAGGRVSSSSAFMLLQTLRGRMDKPYWIQGAWGPDNAASAVLAGAAGVVLGEELWLARESPFHEDERQRLAGLDGSETVCIGTPQVQFRLFKQGSPDALNEIEQRAGEGSDWPDLLHERWLAEGLDPLPLGQGIAFAAGLARRHITAGGILNEFNRVIEHNLTQLRQQPGLTPGNALAEECGVRHPIFQGPMTRVSDVVPFCAAVAENGALPFLALALLRGPEVRKLLEETRERLGERSWGVGILGFVPPELRKEQLDVVLELKPRFAIIAGGRPAQAGELEEAGIATYLHVPSPGLLESFLREGARKFIFEAAALVSALAPALVERGAKIGVLMGTAYLFTEEAVASGAITPMFQEQAAACEGTTLLESGVGHATRCARTPFADEFDQLKKKLIREGRSGDEIRLELEMLNVGAWPPRGCAGRPGWATGRVPGSRHPPGRAALLLPKRSRVIPRRSAAGNWPAAPGCWPTAPSRK